MAGGDDDLVAPFVVTEEELEQSPSRLDGIDAELEGRLLRYGCSVIQEVGVQIQLPQEVAVTAQILLHRFFCRRSLKQFEVEVRVLKNTPSAVYVRMCMEHRFFFLARASARRGAS